MKYTLKRWQVSWNQQIHNKLHEIHSIVGTTPKGRLHSKILRACLDMHVLNMHVLDCLHMQVLNICFHQHFPQILLNVNIVFLKIATVHNGRRCYYIVALCIIIIVRAAQMIKRRPRRWIRSWIQRRQIHGAYHALMQELSTEDHEGFQNFLSIIDPD